MLAMRVRGASRWALKRRLPHTPQTLDSVATVCRPTPAQLFLAATRPDLGLGPFKRRPPPHARRWTRTTDRRDGESRLGSQCRQRVEDGLGFIRPPCRAVDGRPRQVSPVAKGRESRLARGPRGARWAARRWVPAGSSSGMVNSSGRDRHRLAWWSPAKPQSAGVESRSSREMRRDERRGLPPREAADARSEPSAPGPFPWAFRFHRPGEPRPGLRDVAEADTEEDGDGEVLGVRASQRLGEAHGSIWDRLSRSVGVASLRIRRRARPLRLQWVSCCGLVIP